MNNNHFNSMPKNFVPEFYREVSVQPYHSDMNESSIRNYLLGKDAYRRTEYIILEQKGKCAIAWINRPDSDSLFSPIKDVSLLALPTTCLLIEDRTVDTANSTALAKKANEVGLDKNSTLIVRGQDDHVNFIYHPDPVRIKVVEIIPPEPPKLLRMVQHVLTYANLPAIKIEASQIDLRDLSGESNKAESFLVPCRSSGLNFEVPTYFLDEHPARHNWVLLGCERSREIHEHFYGDRPACIEICPRVLSNDEDSLQIIKCCLLEANFEIDGRRAVVPWGANLVQVEKALENLVALKDK